MMFPAFEEYSFLSTGQYQAGSTPRYIATATAAAPAVQTTKAIGKAIFAGTYVVESEHDRAMAQMRLAAQAEVKAIMEIARRTGNSIKDCMPPDNTKEIEAKRQQARDVAIEKQEAEEKRRAKINKLKADAREAITYSEKYQYPLPKNNRVQFRVFLLFRAVDERDLKKITELLSINLDESKWMANTKTPATESTLTEFGIHYYKKNNVSFTNYISNLIRASQSKEDIEKLVVIMNELRSCPNTSSTILLSDLLPLNVSEKIKKLGINL